MGSSTQKQTQSSTSNPWGPAAGALTSAVGDVQNQFATDKANANNNLTSQASGYLSNAINGNYLDPATNPNLGALTKAVTDPIQSSLSAQFSLAGRGNSGDAARYVSQGMTSGLAAPLFNQYNTERGLQQGAAAMAPSMDAAGTQYLDQYLQRLQGLGSMGGTSSGTSTTTQTPSMGQTLGGLGMMGLGLASGGATGPLSLAGGTGSLFGLLGSNPFGMNVATMPWGANTSVSTS